MPPPPDDTTQPDLGTAPAAGGRAPGTGLIGLGLSVIGGTALGLAGVPLGWVIGALLAGAAATAGGLPPLTRVTPLFSRAAQLVIGAALGLQVTPIVVAHLAGWLWLMLVMAALMLLATLGLAILMRRWSGVAPATAWFAMLPGGLAEMALIGAREGAESGHVALIHSTRVALVVLILPGLVTLVLDPAAPGEARAAAAATAAPLPLPSLALVLVLAIAWGGGRLVQLTRLGNGFLLGAIAAVSLISGFGLIGGSLPAAPLIAAQLALGYALSSRFTWPALRASARPLVVAITLLVPFGLMTALVAWVSALAVGLPVGTLLLGVSLGGMAEMILTAQLLGLDPALVTAFHAIRLLVITAAAEPLWRRVRRLRAMG